MGRASPGRTRPPPAPSGNLCVPPGASRLSASSLRFVLASAALHGVALAAVFSGVGGAASAPGPTLSARWDAVSEVPRAAAAPEVPDLPPRVTVELPPEMEAVPPPATVEWSCAADVRDEGPPAPDGSGIVSVASAFGGPGNVRFGPGRREDDVPGAPAGGPPGGAPTRDPPVACFDPPPPQVPESARARLVLSAPPEYPDSARVHGDEGVVVLAAEVLADGSVGDVTVLRSSGSRALDRAAIAAARRWTYAAAVEAGTPVRSVLRLPPIRFRLE